MAAIHHRVLHDDEGAHDPAEIREALRPAPEGEVAAVHGLDDPPLHRAGAAWARLKEDGGQ
eukprot:6170848-Pyramimonas_sp.AAC.1